MVPPATRRGGPCHLSRSPRGRQSPGRVTTPHGDRVHPGSDERLLLVAPRGSDDCAPFTVLFVCTGNICRSPVAERVARAFLDAALGAEAACIHLGSAGTRAVVGSGVHPDSAAVLAGLGGKPAGFAARQLT